MALLDCLACLERWELEGSRETEALQVYLGLRVSLELRELLDLKATRDPRDHRDHQVKLATKDL
jgi:hypothetical protein